ncbi:hypothetical protein EJ04DRAFT_560870 [Polyplosphaeria fusca]|uniref:Uncharacterized protein n=1 Tax=Polyplosphaeria fusca TaxID=682080 RepID=A0A9P4V6G5_9PLEO|nr:hypothetical protein EJ04DRAFT_560870 [Polyplosphaeria fusca]
MAKTSAPAPVPVAGSVISVMISMVTFGVLAVCLTRRLQNIAKWRSLPLASLLIIIIYLDSTLFVFVTAIIARGLGINESLGICDGAILLCLICYMSTKVLIYYFLVEKAYIIRGSRLPRLKTKLWLFNFFGMIVPYLIVIVLNFIFRIAYISDKGVCIIGMKKISMYPLIIFDVIVNVYLTLLFILPLRKLYSYQHNMNAALRTMAFRSFIGSCATLTSSVVNLTILMVLKGEPAWICLMCCNADVLFSVVVLHWVTAIDSNRGTTNSASNFSQGGGQSRSQPGEERRKSGGMPISFISALKTVNKESENLGGTVTTECCRISPKGSTTGSEDDIVELHQIHVHTSHTVEVETDTSSGTGSRVDDQGYPGKSATVSKIV